MKHKTDLTLTLATLFKAASTELESQLRMHFAVALENGDTADFVLYREDECLALGRFIPEGIRKTGTTVHNYFYINNGFMGCSVPSKFWLHFDGDSFVLNSLSRVNPPDEYPENFDIMLKQMITAPGKWQAEQQKLKEMKRFLDTMIQGMDKEA